MKITKSFTPASVADWRNWLAQNHDREQEVWLVYLKNSTNIDYEVSVEEALCFGWIDSIIQKINEERYARKFNPRRMGSKWSETNKRRVVKVIREGRMTEAGMAKVTFNVSEVDASKPKPKRPSVRCLRRWRKLSNLVRGCGKPSRTFHRLTGVIIFSGSPTPKSQRPLRGGCKY